MYISVCKYKLNHSSVWSMTMLSDAWATNPTTHYIFVCS